MNSTAFFDPSYIVSGLVYIFPYLKVTLGLTVSSVCLGTFLALFCAFLEILYYTRLQPKSSPS